MLRHDARRANRSIMAGIMGLAVVVILVVMLFLALSGKGFLPNFFG